MPDGRIEARQISRLKEIGDWVKTNGEAIYGTLGGPYQPNTKFSTTRKGNKIYLCVLGSETATIQLKNIPDRKLVKAYTINGNKVTIENGQNTFNLTTTQSKIPYIIILEFNASVENVAVIDQE